MLIRYLKRKLARLRDDSYEVGRQAGHSEGLSEVLRRQLELRFGPLPATYAARIRQADDAIRLRWAERVLMAVNLAAVFEEEPHGLE